MQLSSSQRFATQPRAPARVAPRLNSRASLRATRCFENKAPQMTEDQMVLLTAKNEIASKCKYLASEAGDQDKQAKVLEKVRECERVLEWFERKCQEPNTPLWVKELEVSGSADELYATIHLLMKLDDKHNQGLPLSSHPVPPTPAPLLSSDPKAREMLTSLFHRADADHNGHLTWLEFNNALHFLGDDMSEEQLELVSSTLGLHGSVTVDDFLAIVDQVELVKVKSDTQFLQHFTHKPPSAIDHVGNA